MTAAPRTGPHPAKPNADHGPPRHDNGRDAFADDRVVTITSYAVEVDPGDPSPGTADRRDRVETVDDA